MSNWEKNIAKNRSWWGHHSKLKNAEEIRSEEFELKRDKKTKDEQELFDEFSLKYLHEEINEGKVPTELEFYFGGENKNFFLKCLTLDLDDKNKNFIDFIASEIDEEIFLQSTLSIYLKTGNVYCENLNLNEFIYDFFNNNRTRQKKTVNATLSFNDSFSSYMMEIFDDHSSGNIDRFAMLSNKNVKSLF